MTTLFALNSTPQTVITPTASPFSTINSRASSCQMSRSGVLSNTFLHSQMYFPRSHCARGLHTAGPLPLFSIRNWMAVASVMRPICPPKASISRTICPFAMPPMAGLQLICPTLFMSMVMRHVFAPMLADAVAASQPACPPPITITSYLNFILINYLSSPWAFLVSASLTRPFRCPNLLSFRIVVSLRRHYCKCLINKEHNTSQKYAINFNYDLITN